MLSLSIALPEVGCTYNLRLQWPDDKQAWHLLTSQPGVVGSLPTDDNTWDLPRACPGLPLPEARNVKPSTLALTCSSQHWKYPHQSSCQMVNCKNLQQSRKIKGLTAGERFVDQWFNIGQYNFFVF